MSRIKIVNLLIAAVSCLAMGASPQNRDRECVNSQRGDGGFGFSVAVNSKYLAISAFGANKVVIYTRNPAGKLIRTKEIAPPQDSAFARIGNGFGRQADNSWLRLYEIYPSKPWFGLGKRRETGFGYSLALNHNVLLIQAKDHKNFSPTLFKDKIVDEEIYLVSLDTTKAKILKKLINYLLGDC